MRCCPSQTLGPLSLVLAAGIEASSSVKGSHVPHQTSIALLSSPSSSSTSDALSLGAILLSFGTVVTSPSPPPSTQPLVSKSLWPGTFLFETSSGTASLSPILYTIKTSRIVSFVSSSAPVPSVSVAASTSCSLPSIVLRTTLPSPPIACSDVSGVATFILQEVSPTTTTSVLMSSGFSDVVRTLRPNGPPETTRSSPSIRPDDLEFLDSLRSATPALERPRPRITGRPRASGNTPRPPLVSLISSLRSAISSASASAATLEATTPGSVTTTTASTRTFGPFINNTTTNVPNFPTGTASGTFFTLTTTPSSTSATPSTSNLPPPPPFSPTPSLPPPNASPSASLPPATIGGITAGVAAAFGLLLLAAFVLYRKRRDRLRPSYLEACEGGSTTLLPQTAPIAPILPRLTIHPAFRNAPISPIRDSPVSPLSPSSATAVVQPYFNPYYTALAQRNPYVFGPIPSSTARDEKRKRRKSLFLLKGWERTRLSGIPEGLEAEETGEDEGEWRKTLSESLGGFRFWESREDISHDWEGGDESEYSRRQSEVEDEGFEHVDF